METKVGYFAQDDGTFPTFTLLKNCDFILNKTDVQVFPAVFLWSFLTTRWDITRKVCDN